MANINRLSSIGNTVIPADSQILPGFKSIRTSANVLFISTNGDPVTPSNNCRDMSAFFAGSGIVIVEGPGHGYYSAPSKCAFDLAAKYMKDGSVPESEVLCQMDVKAD